MELINKFVEQVLSTDLSFSISVREDIRTDGNYHFLQSSVKDAKYIYGIRNWGDEKFTKLDLKPELVAIVANGMVYIVDKFFFQLWNKPYDLPETARLFEEFLKEQNAFATDVVFAKFYENLETQEITGERILNDCKRAARKYLLSKKPVEIYENRKPKDIFNERDVAEILCGFIDNEVEAMKRLEESKASWVFAKSEIQIITEMIENKTVVEDWELAIIEGLRTVDAKTVIVEFEFEGRSAFGKMNLDELIRLLEQRSDISGYNFDVSKQGYKILESLGIDDRMWSSKKLKCKHIAKILYSGKALYERNMEE